MYVNFEIAALLPSPYSRVKKCAKFKTNIPLVSVDSFLYYLSSSNLRHSSLQLSSSAHKGISESDLECCRSKRSSHTDRVNNMDTKTEET